jgi:hypothetical protein
MRRYRKRVNKRRDREREREGERERAGMQGWFLGKSNIQIRVIGFLMPPTARCGGGGVGISKSVRCKLNI